MQIQTGLTHAQARAIGAHFGVWGLHPPVVKAHLANLKRFTLAGHLRMQEREAQSRATNPKAAGPAPEYGEVTTESAGPVRIIHVVGELTKYGSSVVAGPSTLGLRDALRAALVSESVSGIVLLIDSPGGTIAGADDLAADVYAARGRKPIVAYIEDLGASAAYWIASQATKIVANPSGFVGSIGVYTVVEDTSLAAERAGIKAYLVKSGDFKGASDFGVPVDAAALAEGQRLVDAVHDRFVAAVARGRGLRPEALRALANGQLHVAGEAKRVGLIDEIGDLDRAIELAGGTVKTTARGPAVSVRETWDARIAAERAAGARSYVEAAGRVRAKFPGLNEFVRREAAGNERQLGPAVN